MNHGLIAKGALVFGISLGFAFPVQADITGNGSDAITGGIIQG